VIADSQDRAAINAANRRAFVAAASRTLKRGRYARAVITRDGFGKRDVRSLADLVREQDRASVLAKAAHTRALSAPPSDASRSTSGVDDEGTRLITEAVSFVIGGRYSSAAAVTGWGQSITVFAADTKMSISSKHPMINLEDNWNNILQSGRGRDPRHPSEMFSEWQLFGFAECEALSASTAHHVLSWIHGDDQAASQANWNPECEQRQQPASPDGGPHSIDAIGIPETQTDTWHCWLNQERWFEAGAWSAWVTTDMECGY
jgi:hypothetical protein